MNHVTESVASTAQLGWMLGLLTAGFLVFFLGWTWWAFRPANKRYLEEAGRLPLEGS